MAGDYFIIVLALSMAYIKLTGLISINSTGSALLQSSFLFQHFIVECLKTHHS